MQMGPPPLYFSNSTQKSVPTCQIFSYDHFEGIGSNNCQIGGIWRIFIGNTLWFSSDFESFCVTGLQKIGTPLSTREPSSTLSQTLSQIVRVLSKRARRSQTCSQIAGLVLSNREPLSTLTQTLSQTLFQIVRLPQRAPIFCSPVL